MTRLETSYHVTRLETSGTSNHSFLFSLSFFPCEIEMGSLSTEPWDILGNNVDNCEDLDYECAKSASSDDDVACRQVTISLTLGRTGWKAEVIEVKAEEACAGNNTVEGVAAGERKAVLGRREGGKKGPTMSENTWQDGRRTASEEAYAAKETYERGKSELTAKEKRRLEMHELDSSGRDGVLRRDHQGDVAELRCEQGLRWAGVKGARRGRR